MSESPIDLLFERIYGFKPKRAGASYELLVAAALKLTLADLEVKANQYVEGTYSKEKYQIDAAIDRLRIAVEAKDYSSRDQRVGRPDVTKLAGALQDLPFESGIVASATEFSRHATKYAESTNLNPLSKPIVLYHVRPSSEADEEGRVKSIVINLQIAEVDRKNVKFEPILTTRGNETLKRTHKVGDSIQAKVDQFYKADGSVLLTVFDLTSKFDTDCKPTGTSGSWIPPEPAFIMLGKELIEIAEFKYFIPRIVRELQIIIEAKGKAQLIIRSEDGSIDRLLTDVDLRRVTFSNDGDVDVSS